MNPTDAGVTVNPPTQTDISDDEIAALADLATPGPWSVTQNFDGYGVLGKWKGPLFGAEDGGEPFAYDANDAVFIAAARDLVPSLLLRAQQAEAQLVARGGSR